MGKKKGITNAGIAAGTSEMVQRYGSANKEFMVAYSGIDNETGIPLTKGLKDISQSKVNPKFRDANLNQQAGFAAEVQTTAEENAERIIQGKAKTRTTRTDDMRKQSDGKGNTIGGTNEQLYDLAEVDEYGNYITGTGRQLKYVGKNAKECTDKLLSKGYDKYRDNDVLLEIPEDYYEDVQKELNERVKKLEEQTRVAEKAGKSDVVQKNKEKIAKIKKTQKNLRQGKYKKDEALFAREHPKLATAKNIAKVSHQAGLSAAKTSAAIGGSVSAVMNIVAIVKDDKKIEDALKDIAKDTAVSAGVGYGTGFAGSAIKGVMQNSKSQLARNFANSNLPGVVVTSTITFSKTIYQYFHGDIDGTQCLEQLGEQGTGMLSSALFSTIGQAVIPIPVVGGMIGGMVGYALSSACYGNLMAALKDEKLAKEERILAEKMCAEHIKLIRAYRQEMETLINEYLQKQTEVFEDAFNGIKNALEIGDVDGYIASTNKITKALGKEVLFETQEECDEMMLSGITIRL